MTDPHPRIIYLVHTMPGRTRLRLSWLRRSPEEATALANHLSGIEGILDVEVRARTGSVLCNHHPVDLDHEDVLEIVREHTGVQLVVRPGESHPGEIEALERAARSQGAGIAREIASAVRSVNVDLLRMSEGRIDLPIATALGFLTVGAAGIVSSRTLPAPPWFNLAWWAFRTFTTMEVKAIASAEDPRLEHANGQAAPTEQ